MAGIYIRTKKHRQIIAESNRKRVCKESTRLKHITRMLGNKHLLGHKHSNETKLKMQLAHIGMKKPWCKGRKPGFHLTPKQKKKIGLAQRGVPQPAWFSKFISEANKGHIAWNKGGTHTKETREKMSKSHSREKSRFWQGGITNDPYPPKWNKLLKDEIKNRDGHKCQMCGVSQLECIHHLCVHHIDYNKHNLSSKNLITLCSSCHALTNVNREFYEDKYAKV